MKNSKWKQHMASRFFLSLVLLALFIVPASAGGLADSTLGTGLLHLLNDTSLYLTILCPIVGTVAAIFCAIARSMSDEQDGKLWEKRIKIAIKCGVGGLLASGLIAVLSSYFQ